jgi:type IV secretion system protein VirB9
MKRMFAAAALCAAVVVAYAAEAPRAGALDFRVRTADYAEGQVYKITGFFGYHALVMFGADEKIEKVGGFEKGWQIEDLGNKVLIQPKIDDADSNLTVVTNRRVYFFDLSVKPFPKKYRSQASEPEQTYGLRFRYPADEARAAAALAASLSAEQKLADARKAGDNKPRFTEYTYMGSEAIRPYEVWDDGTFTYFKFYAQQDMPTFFVVNDDETESVVNKFVKYDGDTVVVQRVAKQFVLRMGNSVVCIYNENAPVFTPSSGTNTTSDHLQRIVKGEKQ